MGDPVLMALGASPLRAEESVSYSAGAVMTSGYGLSLSVDAYRIELASMLHWA